MTTHRHRRWLQFRLRSVLLLMLIIALWLGFEVNWAGTQQQPEPSASREPLGKSGNGAGVAPTLTNAQAASAAQIVNTGDPAACRQRATAALDAIMKSREEG